MAVSFRRCVSGVDSPSGISYAWAHYSTKQRGNDPSSVLHFAFEIPSLRFLCDHDALLELKVTSLAQGEGENT